jgi:hypothetical protein
MWINDTGTLLDCSQVQAVLRPTETMLRFIVIGGEITLDFETQGLADTAYQQVASRLTASQEVLSFAKLRETHRAETEEYFKSFQQEVVEAIKANGAPMSVLDVSRTVGRPYTPIKVLMHQMQQVGDLVSTSYGTYGLPDVDYPKPSEVTPDAPNEKAELCPGRH